MNESSPSQEATSINAPEPEEMKPVRVQEFQSMTKEASIRSYEKSNRDRIIEATPEVKERFDRIWKKITGKPYWQPVTTPALVVAGPGDERIDPKGCGYKGFWQVVFSPKGREDEPNDVTLSVNGQCLQIKRSENIILPGPFLECADNGLYPVYKQLPGVDRKIVSMIKHFPYSVLRKATKEEYEQQLRAGNAATKAAREAAERME